MVKFEWDEHKNQLNRRKHGVWFEEALQIFDDSNAIIFFDQDHSKDEDRFILLGLSASARALVVVYCERNKGNTVRIISARIATRKELYRYEKGI